MPEDIAVSHCETVFDIKSSKLDDSMAIFRITGLSNVYGITHPPGNMSEINVVRQEQFNDFLRAPTKIEKKRLYFEQAKLFFQYTLERYGIDTTTIQKLDPIIAYSIQHFTLCSHSALYDKKARNETKADFLERKKLLGTGVDKLVLIAFNINKLIQKKENITEQDLSSILQLWENFPVPTYVDPAILGYTALLTIDDAVAQSLRLLEAVPTLTTFEV